MQLLYPDVPYFFEAYLRIDNFAPTRAFKTRFTMSVCRSEPKLRLWTDADPDIPILTEAKAEYAKLK